MNTPVTFFPQRTQQPIETTPETSPIVGDRVELQLLTTLTCNLKCSYCSLGVGDMVGSQGKVSYDVDTLDAFIKKHLSKHEVYVTFYGGEPTLNLDFIEEIMERYPTFRFQLQTNGTLLDNLPDHVLSNLSNILISIDGGEKITDGFRGQGVYRQVVKNSQKVRDKMKGTFTARVTWSSEETSFEELDELASTFDYLYFQFVAGEGTYTPEAMEKKKKVITQLVDKFFSSTDRLYPIIPIMGIVRNKVLPTRATELYHGKTQCRVSTHILNVMPDGKIFPCPDMMYAPEMLQGSVIENWLKPSPLQPHPDMPCDRCEAQPWCRGNCMKNLYLAYVKNDRRYRDNVVDPICDLVRFLGREIDRHDPHAWYAKAPLDVRKTLRDCEVYEYVEIMP
ncbi:radical SAM protein [Candidatus Ferrigenium straubiae]|jgi:radical SAM protein with 4Fe4S-binding SPASM domain|uniref:radical SAM protein n=1 Tax=Candidatus Ferrigenium straubiae TaxID=2919506 RepID=UPI003F4AB5C8